MKLNRMFSSDKSSGSILIELLLSVALVVVILPFIFQYQQRAVIRAQNLAIRNQMTEIQVALERYIVANRPQLLQTVGRNITRVELSELEGFGIPPAILEQDADKYQLRILKSADATGAASLQGVVIRNSDDITPLRTREIVKLSGGTMGFVDGTHAYGTYGAWHTDSVDIGTSADNALIETTAINRDNALYLWRVPSTNPSDAQMMSALNLGGHDIIDATFVNSDYIEFGDGLTVSDVVSNKLIFQNRTTIDAGYKSVNANVAGMMSSDSKNMEISGSLTLEDVGKMSSLTAEKLWVTKLTLPNISVDAADDLALLRVNQSLDMTSGRIDAMFVTVGFTGSITPRLDVLNRIEDSSDARYYWDVKSKTANLQDATFVELNRMATLASYYDGDAGTESGQIFGGVSANKNATVADYMNAIRKIQDRVRTKYRQLNLD